MPAVVSAAVSIFSAVVSGTAGAAVVGAAGLTGVAAAITSTAVNAAVSVALTAGINAIAPKPKVSMQNQMQAAIGAISPTYMIAGRTITAGVSMVENMVSGKNNDIASYIATLSHVGECGSVDAVKWGNDILTFDALGNCISPAKYAGACVLYQRSGGWTQTGMQIASINGFQPAYDQPSEWTSNHRALGCLTAWLVIRTWKDCWKNNNNQPQFICSANTCELYDPRTQALCTTWAQRQNFACWAYSWAKKWSSPTGVKLAGIGWSDSQIDLVALSYWANICDANGWKISAVIDCDPSNKSEVMAAICQGGGATPVYRGGKFSVFYAAPRVSVATITEDDFCAKPKFQSNVPFTYRPNRIFPRFISESSNWTITDGSLVTSSSYLSADGGSEKTDTMEFPYAGGGNAHVGQLAAYSLANAREPFRETLFLKPQARYKFSVTDCIIINAPTYGYNNYKCIVTKRDFADDFTSQVEAVTETDTKHPFALGQTTTPPDFAGQFKLNGDYCPAPAAGSWSVVATQLTQGGTSIPCLKISGASDYNLASAIVIRYRLNTIGSTWLGIANLPPTATKHEIVSITPNTSYIIGVSYRNQFGNEGAITELTAVDTGTFVAGSAANVDWQSGVTGTGKPSDNANNTALNPTTGALTGISSGAGTIVDNTKISIGANGALNGAGGGQVTIGGLGYTGALNATRNAVSSGTAAPSGGSNGDMYVQVDGSGNAVLTWVNIGGTWKPDYDAKTNVTNLTATALAGSSALNKNYNFSTFDAAPTSGASNCAGWGIWAWGNGRITRNTGKFGSPYALGLGWQSGEVAPTIYSTPSWSPDFYVAAGTPLIIEVTVEALTDVNWMNFGIYWGTVPANSWSWNDNRYYYFSDNAATDGVTRHSDAAGTIRTFSILWKPNASGYFHLLAHAGWGNQSGQVLQRISFHRLIARFATAAEIAADKALNNPLGNGTTLATAINQKIDTATANANFATASSVSALTASLQGDTTANLLPNGLWTRGVSDWTLSYPYNWYWGTEGGSIQNGVFVTSSAGEAFDNYIFSEFDITTWKSETFAVQYWLYISALSGGNMLHAYIERRRNSDNIWEFGGNLTDADNTGVLKLYQNQITVPSGYNRLRLVFLVRKASGAPACAYWLCNCMVSPWRGGYPAFTEGRAVNSIYAQTSINQTAIAETNGNVNAIISLNASTNTKKAEFVLAADRSVSAIRMTADVMQIGDAPNGTFRNAFQVVSGQTQINDALIRNLQVLANASDTMGFPVALKPRKFSGIDGANITFPGTLTSIPYVRWDGQNPPAVGSGETYQIKADNVSGTGFTVSAKKFVAGTTNVRDSGAGSNVGGTPTWQVNKPTTEVADGNAFNYFVTVAVPRTGFHALGGGYYDFSYYGEIDVYYYNGSVWIYLFTDIIDISGEQYGVPATTLTYTNYQIQANFTLGANGKFGVHPKAGSNITAFNKVTYSVTAQSSAVSLAGTWSFDVTA